MHYQSNTFTVDIPDDWQDRSIISFSATVSPNEFAPNVVITREIIDSETSIEDYTSNQFNITQAEVQGLKIIDQQNTTINGNPAVQVIQSISAHGLNLQQLQTFILGNDEIYIVTCTAMATSFEQHLPRFQKIAQTFQLNR